MSVVFTIGYTRSMPSRDQKKVLQQQYFNDIKFNVRTICRIMYFIWV